MSPSEPSTVASDRDDEHVHDPRPGRDVGYAFRDQDVVCSTCHDDLSDQVALAGGPRSL